jgi:predicted dehydrogenase
MISGRIPEHRPPDRRQFLKTSTVAAAGTVLASARPFLSNAHAAGSDVIKVGLIGCGGRGTGAAEQSVNSAPNVRLVALGDVFKDRLDHARAILDKQGKSKVDVPEDHCFVGLDAYEKVLASGVDLVILATPPGFRPRHLQAAVAAGKHIFTEKPVAVDGPGIRAVLEVAEEAKRKNLGIAAGTQRRHQKGYIETMKQVHDGAIGAIVAARCYWNQGPLWVKERQSGWTDLEWQLRNWLYFAWLSGDHIVEQHVHNLDVCNWAIGHHPIRAVGMGGRQVRTGPEYGHIFDHFAVDYEYPNGVHVASQCRQIGGCENSVSEALRGTKGFCQANRYQIKGERTWHFHEPESDPYQQEHTDLVESIRAAQPINELRNVAESTLTAIMGRMSAYTGKAITWEQALNSQEELMPAHLEWDMSLPVPPVAVPGKTAVV